MVLIKKRSKRGSYIMEASLVLPILIFAVITVVLIIMFFYSQMTERSQMHIALRQEAGLQTETMRNEDSLDWDGEIYTNEKRGCRSRCDREKVSFDGTQGNSVKERGICDPGELQRCRCGAVCTVLQFSQGDKT